MCKARSTCRPGPPRPASCGNLFGYYQILLPNNIDADQLNYALSQVIVTSDSSNSVINEYPFFTLYGGPNSLSTGGPPAIYIQYQNNQQIRVAFTAVFTDEVPPRPYNYTPVVPPPA